MRKGQERAPERGPRPKPKAGLVTTPLAKVHGVARLNSEEQRRFDAENNNNNNSKSQLSAGITCGGLSCLGSCFDCSSCRDDHQDAYPTTPDLPVRLRVMAYPGPGRYEQQSLCRKTMLCLVGRQMRKMLALLCLIIALYGYVTVINSHVLLEDEPGVAFVKAPARDDHFVRRDGKELPLCPAYPEGLEGQVYVNQTRPLWEHLRDQNPDLMTGGHWAPQDCIARHRVAIVVPYRSRETNLLLFLQHIHPFLKKQKIEYTIFVAEQAPGHVFNRGLVRNVGFVEANKLGNYDCTIFHDVDLLPMDDRNLYYCPDHPRHMCVATNYIFNFMPLYNNSYALFGGVVSFRNDQFRSVNGYSNIYFGWGAEDDDLHNRIVAMGMPPYRYPDKIGRYFGSPHQDEAVLQEFLDNEQDRFKMLRISKYRINLDGLNTMRYTVRSISKRRLYTRIFFDVEQEWYDNEAKNAVNMYHDLFGNLSPFWKHLDFTPYPYWYKKKKEDKQIENKNK